MEFWQGYLVSFSICSSCSMCIQVQMPSIFFLLTYLLPSQACQELAAQPSSPAACHSAIYSWSWCLHKQTTQGERNTLQAAS